MEFINQFIDLVLHLDKHLIDLLQHYGTWTYAILFLIIFCETGLVVTPFLPGDSLLFAIGALSAQGGLDIVLTFVLLSIAAILGDTVNYWIGYLVGPKVFASETSRWLNRKQLQRTHEFYEKYGGKTIIFARFMPIIRTFAPFVAGIGKMSYPRFLLYNVIGGVVWIGAFLTAGFRFGNLDVVKENFSLVIIAIIIISIMPALIEFLRARRAARA
ncbi:MAG: DedA family protein [Blastocatellia bacterium]|nr:DedA family protein [Blastocatellia bacterium]